MTDYRGRIEIRDREGLDRWLDQAEADDGWQVISLDYELGYLFEPKSAPAGWRADASRPLATIWRFSGRQAMTADAADAWLMAQASGAAGVGGLSPAMNEHDYLSAVDRIISFISAGDCYQVNLTFPLAFSWFGSPLALYRRLRDCQPVRHGGFVGDARQGIVSLSPELFIARQGDVLRTRPMKGTVARDVDPAQLKASAKDRAENLMIVDLLRNDLGRVARAGSVRVDQLFEIEAYPTVWQMVSAVSADVKGRRFGEILAAMFPCGSITGAPKVRAMQIIGELESAPRRQYTGALGCLGPSGDFSLNVAIRTLELGPDQRGRMGVGSGIVADSSPQAEWAECLLKGRFLAACDPGLQLIETLRLENGNYPHRAGHLQRLQRSAAWFGFRCDIEQVEAALAAQPQDGLWRVRLTLDKAGQLDMQSLPLTDEPAGARHAWLASETIDARDPLRSHKTTVRAAYDRALASIAGTPAVFDVLFVNAEGELAEGARSTIFVERDGRLLTPPLRCGALPGVLRAALIASGRAEEQVLFPEDLAGGFWLGNALRGLVRVTLSSGTPDPA